MTRTPKRTALELVNQLAAATGKKLDEDAIRLFVDVLAALDEAVAREVVARLRHTDSFFPSEARIRHIASEVIAEHALAESDRMLPPPSELTDMHPDVARANIQVLREVQSKDWQAQLRRILDDQYPTGWTWDDAGLVTMAHVYDRVVALTGRAPFPDPEATLRPVSSYHCAKCRDTHWVEQGIEPLTVEPCERCTPVQHERHRRGHLASGHDCQECRDLRRNGWEALVEYGYAV